MQAARRIYLYVMAGITLAVIAVGLSMLIDVAISGTGILEDRFGGEGSRQQLSQAVAMLGVGLPVWAVHWWIVQRGLAEGRPEYRPEEVRCEGALDDLEPHLGPHEDVREEVGQVEDLDRPFTEGVGERVVLLPRPLHPQDVVEEERVLVARREPPQLEVRSVEDDAGEAAHLGADVEPPHPSRDADPARHGVTARPGPARTRRSATPLAPPSPPRAASARRATRRPEPPP